MRKYVTLGAVLLLLPVVVAPNLQADPNDSFPKGPYKATLISESILYPSLLGVKAGLPVADVSGVLLPNGKLRAYVFAQNKGIEILESTDGQIFTRVGNAFGGDKGQGQPRVMKLSAGGYRMINMTGEGLSCSSSTDGLLFTIEAKTCIKKSDFSVLTMLSGPGIVKLSSGGYRAYFSSLGAAGTGPDPQKVFSATSPDSLVWTAEAGVRIGKGSNIEQSAEHPTAISHSDGTVTMFFFDNGSGSAQGQNGTMGLYYANSKDGLNFSAPLRIDLSGLAPKFRSATGNDPDIFLDKDGNMLLWAGDFDHEIGGFIFALKLTHTDVAPTPTKASPTASPTGPPPPQVGNQPSPAPAGNQPSPAPAGNQPSPAPAGNQPSPPPVPKESAPAQSPIKTKITINCVKGKTIMKVTSVEPKCPSDYIKKK